MGTSRLVGINEKSRTTHCSPSPASGWRDLPASLRNHLDHLEHCGLRAYFALSAERTRIPADYPAATGVMRNLAGAYGNGLRYCLILPGELSIR